MQALSEVSRDIAQVLFASVVIEPIVSQVANMTGTIAGLVAVFIFFGMSVVLPDVVIK